MVKLDISNIDSILTSKYRLAILASEDEIDFNYFKTELDISDGNLSTHMTKLETGGYISVKKRFEGKKPKTGYRITEKGLKQYEAYLNEMAKILKGDKDEDK